MRINTKPDRRFSLRDLFIAMAVIGTSLGLLRHGVISGSVLSVLVGSIGILLCVLWSVGWLILGRPGGKEFVVGTAFFFAFVIFLFLLMRIVIVVERYLGLP